MKTITNNILNKLFQLLEATESFVFLDTSKPDSLNRKSLLFLNPIDRLQYHEGDDEVHFLDNLQKIQQRGLCLAGWFSYEFGYLLEPTLRNRLKRNEDKGVVLADLGVFESYYTFDHHSGKTNFPFESLQGINFANHQKEQTFTVQNLCSSLSEEEYIKALERILQYIEAGDTYQVNYTLKLFFDFHGSAEQFYRVLRRNQSVSYGAYIRWNEQRIMSFSPELFFWRRNSDVMVRPMKGTLKRGKTLEEDIDNRKFLQTDIKNQSENVMIVDLLRNDLGRLMHQISGGRVEVDSLFDVETYETLLQMTSTITGKTSPEALEKLSLHSFLKAIFPCGSVTGAPKIRTMEIIDELEKSRRGVYTGAIGYMLPDGEAVYNVPIRTVVLNGTAGEMGIGSGIVHDSRPSQEWQECLLKGRFLTEPQQEFKLIETLLWLPQQGYFLLEKHLQRLQNSANYFLFQCDREEIEKELTKLAKGFGTNPRKIRLLLGKDGQYSYEIRDCSFPAHLMLPLQISEKTNNLPKIMLSRERVNSNSAWFYHKTTNRKLYNEQFTKASANGYVEAIFLNDRGKVTEGCISNIFLFKGGEYLTPPIKDGLLAGIMREHLLETVSERVREQSVTVDDLQAAEMVFICNSVRGVTQVKLEQNTQ